MCVAILNASDIFPGRELGKLEGVEISAALSWMPQGAPKCAAQRWSEIPQAIARCTRNLKQASNYKQNIQ
ncbi:MAG: hypothetical protein JGK21_18540 [Microcoleus sp. PH2017_22_RUC_O_B]|uniref:hypothetical protein n=1 Tax=Microcoleus sp. PH2017_10_PVI_O_A TaxID=2798821 RepID=UPI001DA564B3|nr:hypothetical protein [Microcoleus sp. PH2017_10_PVI_O_A]MCC3529983.1 hypothetical protein [Microcoleus sp. PH2017_21_RUC_O_A]MCC3542318.1 hypothetical protein [Microcoleus sp. PH2017_22_RUC_O_B]